MSRSQENTNVTYPERESNDVSFVVQPAPCRYGHCCWDLDITSSYYNRLTLWKRDCAGTRQLSSSREMQKKVEEWLLEEGIANV